MASSVLYVMGPRSTISPLGMIFRVLYAPSITSREKALGFGEMGLTVVVVTPPEVETEDPGRKSARMVLLVSMTMNLNMASVLEFTVRTKTPFCQARMSVDSEVKVSSTQIGRAHV